MLFRSVQGRSEGVERGKGRGLKGWVGHARNLVPGCPACRILFPLVTINGFKKLFNSINCKIKKHNLPSHGVVGRTSAAPYCLPQPRVRAISARSGLPLQRRGSPEAGRGRSNAPRGWRTKPRFEPRRGVPRTDRFRQSWKDNHRFESKIGRAHV